MSRNRNKSQWWRRAILYSFLTVLISIPGFIIVSTLSLLTSSLPEPNAIPSWRYSQFIREVEQNRIETVSINEDHSQALVNTSNRSQALVKLPYDPELINILTQHQVTIYTVPSINEPTLLTRALILLPFIAVFLGSCLWVWTLVDCATNEVRAGNTKTVWIVIIIFISWVGALLYLLVRRPQRLKEIGR